MYTMCIYERAAIFLIISTKDDRGIDFEGPQYWCTYLAPMFADMKVSSRTILPVAHMLIRYRYRGTIAYLKIYLHEAQMYLKQKAVFTFYADATHKEIIYIIYSKYVITV